MQQPSPGQAALDFSAPEPPPPPPVGRFNGPDYVPERDARRLTGQILRVWECMRHGGWFTLERIARVTGDPEASISAQLRHLRKPRFGGHKVNKRYVRDGLFEYELVVASNESPV